MVRNVTHIRPLCLHDFKCLRPRELEFTVDNVSKLLDSSHGNAHTFLVKGEPAAIVGASLLWPGVWQVWAFISDRVRGHGVPLTKSCEIILSESAKAFKVKRYNAIVDGTKQEYVRWLKLLKFQYEFTMYHALPKGGDVYGYVRWEGK